MRTSFKLGVAAALLAASQVASAGLAEIRISNITLSVSGGEWWYWLPTEVTWLPTSAGAAAGLENPSFSDTASGWHGTAIGATVQDGNSTATASLTAKTSGDLNGATASAKVVANGGQMGWAFANVIDNQIMVGGNATVTLSATIDSITATGNGAQANAYMEFCSTDFVTDVCEFANYAEAFVDSESGDYDGPMTLTASWTNPGDTTWAKIRFGLTAAADTTIPEPGTWALALTGLVGLGAARRRRKSAA